MRKERVSWRSLLIEVGVIVFSVLLALGVDEWRGGRQEREEVAVAMRAIRGEIADNRRKLEARILARRRWGSTRASSPSWRGSAASWRTTVR